MFILNHKVVAAEQIIYLGFKFSMREFFVLWQYISCMFDKRCIFIL